MQKLLDKKKGDHPPPASRRRGVALGVLGLMLLSFFSIVFMLGRHSYWHRIYDEVVHWDPHPHGMTRHTGPVSGGEDPEGPAVKNAFERLKVEAASGAAKQTDTTGTSSTAGKQQQKQKPADAKPADKPKPAVVKPKEESKPKLEVKPADKPAEKPKEVEKKPEQKPAEQKPAEQKPAEQKPKVEEKKAAGDEGITDLDKQYKPTKEMVQKIAQDGYLVVTWANWHYQDFVHTWVHHVKKVGITGYIVGAMDDHLLKVLIEEKINTFSMRSGLTLGDFGWGSKTFAKMGREKIRLIRVFLELGVDVVIADVDVLWLRNPIPFFKRYPTADILTSSDHLDATVPDENLERWPHAASAANIGIMLFREKSMDFVNHWIDVIEKDETVWDQNAFNDLFRRGVRSLPDDKQNLFMGYDGKLKMGILPVSQFCSGHTFFVQRLGPKLGLEPYALHATFQFSGTPGKRHRMREWMYFADPPEYYDHKVGFIAFDFDQAELGELVKHAGPNTGNMDLGNVKGHFALVNYQIVRIRTALAIATTLGRGIIVPQMWCGLDRWWAPHSGRIPGSKFELPFQCPMDHVFDLEGGWHAKLNEAEMGPNIEYRESSFLRNPNIPVAVNNSRAVVEICPVGTAGCSDGSAPAPLENGRVRVQAGLLSEQLKKALANVAGTKVLTFTTMNNVFKNFTSEGDFKKFFNRMRQYTSIWCCIHAHPGHIHYDMWNDVPHVDKFGRQWLQWEPKTGP